MRIDATRIATAKECIAQGLKLMKEGKPEQAIRDSFTSYLRKMFPDASDAGWVNLHVEGAEGAVRIRTEGRETIGFVDNLVGLTAIEYESDLNVRARYDTGFQQVRSYCAALINDGHLPELVLGVLSDTVRWFAYSVRTPVPAPQSTLTADDVGLDELDAIDTSPADDRAAEQLILFLDKYLGRRGARPLSAASISSDLGFESRFGQRHIATLGNVVQQAFSQRPDYAKLISDLWGRFVTFARDQELGGGFDRSSYIDEFYLVTLGKLICANVIEKRALLGSDRDLKGILSGEFFRSKGLPNLVEHDYFGWLNTEPYLQELIPVCHEIQSDLQAYNFEQSPAEDLFGRLMAQLGRRSRRLLLGQEWTPSWLARQIVNRVLSALPHQRPVQLVDMACGSGTIIVETVKLIRERQGEMAASLGRGERIALISQAITGFDIDPLAVILSKISWLVAARDWLEPLGAQDIFIPVYHADSLFAITPLSDSVASTCGQDLHEMQIGGHTLALPTFLLSTQYQSLFDALIDRGYSMALATSNEPPGTLTSANIELGLADILSSSGTAIDSGQMAVVREFLYHFVDKVAQLIRSRQNGIWAFILRNSYRPALVAGRFDGLVSNPPWLALSKIADNPYRVALRRKAEDLAVTPSGPSHLHIELATIFLLHAVDRYLRDGGVAGCIVPETVLNGYHHSPFRAGNYASAAHPVNFTVDEIWRVADGTFKNKAIVLFGTKAPYRAKEPDPIPGALAEARGLTPRTFSRLDLGSLTAWSDQSQPKREVAGFFVPARFREGADILPRTLFLCESKPMPGVGARPRFQISSIDRTRSRFAFAVKDAKRNEDFAVTPRVVPGSLLFDVLTSALLTPFHLATPLKAFLPIQKGAENIWTGLSEMELAAMGSQVQDAFREIARAITPNATLTDIWKKINILNKLRNQKIRAGGYLVLAGAGGKWVCATFVPTGVFDINKLVIDQTLYWAQVDSENEAIYLVGGLNSRAVNLVIRNFQPRGARGERHVHKLAIGATPPYDESQPAHQGVVDKTRELLAEYQSARTSDPKLAEVLDPNNGHLASRRRAIRQALEELPSYAAYDEACQSLYGVELSDALT